MNFGEEVSFPILFVSFFFCALTHSRTIVQLPLIILANWRGFSGGMRDMYNEILKYGSYIVDALKDYKQVPLLSPFFRSVIHLFIHSELFLFSPSLFIFPLMPSFVVVHGQCSIQLSTAI